MKSLLKKLVAFKQSNDIHRVSVAWGWRRPGGLYPSCSDDVYAAVYAILGKNFKLVKFGFDLYNKRYIASFEVLTGEDVVMLRLMMPTHYKIGAFKIIKPERFPKEYCKRYQSTIQSHFKQKRKGPK